MKSKNDFFNNIKKFLFSKGFKHYEPFIFVRCNSSNVFHIIDFIESKSGKMLDVKIYCWVPEINARGLKVFPKNLGITCGGSLADDRLMFGGYSWEIETTLQINKSYGEIINALELFAFSWFDTVNTRQDFIDNVYDHLKEELPSYVFDNILNRTMDVELIKIKASLNNTLE